MKRSLFALAASAFGVAAPSVAQDVPLKTLSQPTATYSDGLGSMRGVRELADGRVLIADGLGEALIVWLPGQGADTLSNVGEGPGEYQVPDGLYPFAGGGTLLVDIGNARLVALDADLQFGETWSIAQGEMGPGMTLLIPAGTDDRGGIYYRQRLGMSDADSSGIGRFDAASEETDRVGMFKLPETQRQVSGGANNRREMVRPLPLRAQDAWGVAPDGRVAVARSDDYRIEWLHPDGSRVSGPTVDYRPVRVGGAEKEAWLENLGGGLGVMMTQTNQGAPQLSFRRGGMGDDTAGPDEFDWPDVMPAFPAGAVRVAPDGMAWVERHRPAGEPSLFDVFDGAGHRVAQVELPAERTLVGFGQGTVYLTRSDDFDFAWLERYEAPTF